jgi:hypothetical protein
MVASVELLSREEQCMRETAAGPQMQLELPSTSSGGSGLVVGGTRLPVHEMAAKVVAYVAVEQRPVTRRTLCGCLVAAELTTPALGALRTTMFRAKGIDRALLVVFEVVALAPVFRLTPSDRG